MKPVPLVMLSWKPACDSSENHAPASPAMRPPMTTALYRMRIGSMPSVSAACGCSPTARMRSPKAVRNSTQP